MKHQHIDGPWFIEENRDMSGCFYVCHKDTECDATAIAAVQHWDHEGSVNKATAQLIAAAPELLEAVEAVISHWFYAEEEGGISGDEAIKKCLAVASKATGQEPQTQT